MKIYKDKQYLVFDYEDKRIVKYDFATKQAIGMKGKPVKNLCNQLSGLTIEKMIKCCSNKEYADFLECVRNLENYSIHNVSTILDRIYKYSKLEQLFSSGLGKFILNIGNFKYSIDEIPKSLIKLCHEYCIWLSNDMVDFYKENPDAHYIGYNLEYISLTSNDIYNIWNAHNSRWDNDELITFSYFNELINKFGYNAKHLYIYLDRIKTFEAVEDMNFLMRELHDYVNMMSQLSSKYDKYPRNLLTTIRIANRNYNRMKKEFSEELFKKRINKQYECSFGDYVFIYPNSPKDIKQEACMQNNCVASYIDRVIDGECHILFLRKKNKPNDSLVTIEVRNNKIVQARRKFNDPVTDEDQKVIDAFNKKFADK